MSHLERYGRWTEPLALQSCDVIVRDVVRGGQDKTSLAHGVRKEHLFCDEISGAREDRPGLIACNAALRCGDTLVVWRLDRLGRSMCHLVNMIEDLKKRGIGFRSISDGMIDTTSASGELVLNIFSALAQFERRLIQERTNARPGGGQSAWTNGRSASNQPRACQSGAGEQAVLRQVGEPR